MEGWQGLVLIRDHVDKGFTTEKGRQRFQVSLAYRPDRTMATRLVLNDCEEKNLKVDQSCQMYE